MFPASSGTSQQWNGYGDLPLKFHPALIRASAVLNRSQTLDQRKLEFSGFIQGSGLVALPEFISEIGTLLPIAPCGRSSL
jgi:hypothetical protein